MKQKITSNINNWLLLLSLLAGIASCKKELNQTPVSSATQDAVFSNEDGLKLYVNSFYNTSGNYQILPAAGDVFRGDEIADYGARSQAPDYLRDTTNTTYSSRQSNGWSWTALRNVNYFIANCNNPAVSETVRNNYIGIARFFRAWFYFDKLKRFGNVPWVSTPMATDDANLYSGRDDRTLVIDSMIADLDFACQNISLKKDATSSQITKWIAYGLKSRVCLFEGTFRKYQASYGLQSTSDALLEQAANAAKVVIDSSGYSLSTAGGNSSSYRQLFISATPVTSEVMLSSLASTSLSVYNDANWYFTSSTYGVRYSFTRDFINTYLSTDGTPFTNVPGHDTMTFAHETQNRDYRLQQTIRTPGFVRIANGASTPAPPVFSYTYTGYQPIKWSQDDPNLDNGANNTNSVSIMRYAEILLNYAEAKAELRQLTDDDWSKTIGALRTRAGIMNTIRPVALDNYMHDTYFSDVTDPSLMEIRRERGIELVLEGFRYWDLVRWKHGELLTKKWNGIYVPGLNIPMDLNSDGKLDVCFVKETPASPVPGVTYINVAATISSGVNPQRLSNDTYGEVHWLDNVTRTWADFKYLYPIPFNDLTLNPALEQNPGWQ